MKEEEKRVMSGGEIFDYLHCPGFLVNSRRNKKWVDVEWLKGEIKNHQKAFDYGSYWVNVVNLLQLLEEKPLLEG